MAPLKFSTSNPSRIGYVTQRLGELHFDLPPNNSATLPFSSIKAITLDRSLFFGSVSIEIRLRDETVVPEIKRPIPSQISLKIKKANTESAEELVKTVSFDLMESSVDDLLDFMDNNT